SAAAAGTPSLEEPATATAASANTSSQATIVAVGGAVPAPPFAARETARRTRPATATPTAHNSRRVGRSTPGVSHWRSASSPSPPAETAGRGESGASFSAATYSAQPASPTRKPASHALLPVSSRREASGRRTVRGGMAPAAPCCVKKPQLSAAVEARARRRPAAVAELISFPSGTAGSPPRPTRGDPPAGWGGAVLDGEKPPPRRGKHVAVKRGGVCKGKAPLRRGPRPPLQLLAPRQRLLGAEQGGERREVERHATVAGPPSPVER